jgi:phosphonopyruvate decarboxylase
MIKPKDFYNSLSSEGIEFFSGVPDSLLKDFCAYITDNSKKENHIIAANEGNAIALAAGYNLATSKIGLVYMQNSGEGNAVNPLTSLTDKEVYSIPMLLMIGWRGEPGKHDEPQHKKQGRITLDLLETLEIPYSVLPDNLEGANSALKEILNNIRSKSCPGAIVIKEGTFEKYNLLSKPLNNYTLTREEALKTVIDSIGDSIVVSTTGKLSRELFEYRESLKQGHEKDFLTVGSMGHASQIALGIALQKQDKEVYCLDGDGAAIMHLGGLAIIGSNANSNFKHIIFNNGCHESVGGQPTAAFDINLSEIAKSCGYKLSIKVSTKEEIVKGINNLKSVKGPCMLEILVKSGARADLGRPTTTPIENKEAFMSFLGK